MHIQQKQRGFTIVELMAALLVAAMMFVGISSMIDSSLEETKAQQAGLYQSQVVAAASQYVTNNYEALAAAPLNVTLPVPLAALVAGGLLPAGVQAANPYGQSACVLVRPRLRDAAQPAGPVVLDALVVGEGTVAQEIPERNLAFAAARSGRGGGFISARNPGAAQSSSGTWALNAATVPTLAAFAGAKCSANAVAKGSLSSALFFDGPGQPVDFLYRDAVAGRPELNRMNAPIGMANGALATELAACGADAAIAVDAVNRNLLTCNGAGLWQRAYNSSWKAPVDSFAALDALVGSAVGDVRMATDIGRAFTYMGPVKKWAALAVDQNGDMVVPHNLAVQNDLDVARDAKIGRDATVAKHVQAHSLTVEDYVWAQTYTIGARYKQGDQCHLWLGEYNQNGGKIYVNVVGTIVLDNVNANAWNVPMICMGPAPNPDNSIPEPAYWNYINGTATR